MILQSIRNRIPLKIRIIVGPYIALVFYIVRTKIVNQKDVPRVLSMRDTINTINQNNLSVIRFGDGEMSLMDNQDLGFQKFDKILGEKIKHIIQVTDSNLLICIPSIFGNINNFSKRSFWFTLHHLFRYHKKWLQLLNTNQVYGDAFITRPYLNFKNTDDCEHIFNTIKGIWNEKKVVLIEGEKTRLGVGNDLFKKVTSIKRILCPSENAFLKYRDIIEETKKVGKDNIILLSLGPTAKVIAYELFLLGYRVLDIGHIDMEYEMFLNNSKIIIPVKYKYFNEIDERKPEDCLDGDYVSQIISIIK